MKKRILALLFGLGFILSSIIGLSGCTLLSKSSERYYQEVVAYVGTKTVTREEVLNAYNNYSFYTYYGYTQEQVFDMVFNMLINQKIVVQEAEKTIELTITDKNEIWKSVRDAINSYIDTYENEVRKLHGLDEIEKSEEEKKEIEVFAEYVRTLPGGEIKPKNDTILKSGFEIPKKADSYYRYLGFNKYLTLLQKQSQINGYNLTREQALEKEINRLYKSTEENKYSELYQIELKKQLTISQQDILDRYNLLLNKQIQSYSIKDVYESAVTNTTAEELLLYHNSTTDSYFYVQQILIQFSDEIKEQLKNHDGYVLSIESNNTVIEELKESYLQLREELAQEIEIKYIDAEVEEKTTTFAEIWAELQLLVSEYESENCTYEAALDMAKSFFEYKYYYSGDQVKDSNEKVKATTRSLDSLWNLLGYVFASDESIENGFAKEFSDGAYELYNNYKNDNKYTINWIVTDYGVHFIMFTGINHSGPIAQNNYESLASTTISMITNQTIADYIYEILLKEKEQSVVSDKITALNSLYVAEGKIDKKISKYKEFMA